MAKGHRKRLVVRLKPGHRDRARVPDKTPLKIGDRLQLLAQLFTVIDIGPAMVLMADGAQRISMPVKKAASFPRKGHV